MKKLGFTQANLQDAIGDWQDGAENSLAQTIHGATDLAKVRYLAAFLGHLTNQKSVLLFQGGEGPDALHRVKVQDTDLGRVRSELDRFGVGFRTLIPGPTGTEVMVATGPTFGGDITPNVKAFAEAHGAQVSTTHGSGEFVGDPSGTSRPKARAEYRRIISDYESNAGVPKPDNGTPPGVSGQRQAPAGGSVERGMYYPGGQMVPEAF